MKMTIGRLVNQRLECPVCHTIGTWNALARARARSESTIQGFRCKRCQEEIVVKVPREQPGTGTDNKFAEKEYLVLRKLLTAFPQDDHFGTLMPVAYLETDGWAAMVTRKFKGVDLVRYASKFEAGRMEGFFRPAGASLRKLHDSCSRSYQPQSLGVTDKITYLAQTYAADLNHDPDMHAMYARLVAEAAPISGLRLRTTWSHGDFKPENILCDGYKYVIVDTKLEGNGAFVYDLASFLDHLLISGQGANGAGIGRRYQQAAEDFLDGYGGINRQELAALRWAQSYFMIHYWGRYHQRGPLSAIFANWKMKPLVQKLVAQL